MSTVKKATRYTSPDLEKGFDILELLADTATPLSATEIAKQLGRTVSEVYRMIISMELRGYLARTETQDRYYLTSKLFLLANRRLPDSRVIEASVPELRRLSGKIHQSCHLSILMHDEAMVAAKEEAREPYGYTVRLGAHVPALKCASGRSLLAFLEPDKLGSIIGKKAKDPKLLARLKVIRDNRVDVADSEFSKGICDIGSPVLDQQGHVRAAIGVCTMEFIGKPLERSIVVEATIEAAQRISTLLGFTDGHGADA